MLRGSAVESFPEQDLVVCMWLHVPWLLLMDDEYRAKYPNATRLIKAVFDHPTTRKLSPVSRPREVIHQDVARTLGLGCVETLKNKGPEIIRVLELTIGEIERMWDTSSRILPVTLAEAHLHAAFQAIYGIALRRPRLGPQPV